MRKLLLTAGTLMLLQFSAIGATLTSEQKLMDFQQLLQYIEASYGPKEYKFNNKMVSFQKLKTEFEAKIQQTKTNEEFYYLIVQFIANFKDGHFGARIPTTFISQFPVTAELVNGKVLIDIIDRDKVSEADFDFERGDEIVKFNDRPVMDVVKELKSYVGSGYDLTEKNIATWLLFRRPARMVPAPEGEFKVSIRRGTSDIIEEVTLEWQHDGEKVVETLDDHPVEELTALAGNSFDRNFDALSLDHLRADFSDSFMNRKFMCSGETRIDIPKEATMIIEKPFAAYYYPTEKGSIGYLRIPHYSPKDKLGKPDFELRFKQYEFAVAELEKNTVALVIDQDHNCGGSVGYLEKMVGLFMNESYPATLFELRASKNEYLSYSKYINEEINEHTIDYGNVIKVRDLIHEFWKKGDYLTSKTPIHGRNMYPPQTVQYTKPILMLIDQYSGSGGDAFPSLLQGYKRATLLGTRTSGLGGHIEQMPALLFSQINIHMTRSLFFRPDGVAVENNGAVPDINYTLTRDDFMYGYKNYQKFYTQEVLKLLEK